MTLYAIGDLHLGGAVDKPMDVFGEHWADHAQKIRANWQDRVKATDTVIIAGDISWAMNMEEAQIDLAWISGLPGHKVLVRGNHDYWWGSITKLNRMYENMSFLQNNFFTYQDYALCGTRGWVSPTGEDSCHDYKIYLREVHRLNLSLTAAREAGHKKFITVLHYPPTNEQHHDSGFTELIQRFKVEHVVYGHLHHPQAFSQALQGRRQGSFYHLVSCDYLQFQLKRILPYVQDHQM